MQNKEILAMSVAISMFSSNANRNTNQIPVQISVKEASTRLRLTERTILNFIKQRRIDAVKVGKEWFIDYPSFVAFGQRYQIKDFIESKETEVTVETAEISQNFSDEKNKVKFKENKMSLTSLRVFHHCSKLFESENFKKIPVQDFEKRIRELGFFNLENLGAGFYSFGISLKLKHYNQARCHLGAILALLLQKEERRIMWKAEIEEIETRILPAFGALLRKIEKRSSSSKVGT